jgi:hypothetical protein
VGESTLDSPAGSLVMREAQRTVRDAVSRRSTHCASRSRIRLRALWTASRVVCRRWAISPSLSDRS